MPSMFFTSVWLTMTVMVMIQTLTPMLATMWVEIFEILTIENSSQFKLLEFCQVMFRLGFNLLDLFQIFELVQVIQLWSVSVNDLSMVALSLLRENYKIQFSTVRAELTWVE